MAQQFTVRHTHPSKLQPFISFPLDLLTLRDASIPSYPLAKSEKGDPAAFDSELPQEDCPDGGLQAWLVVLGVRLSA